MNPKPSPEQDADRAAFQKWQSDRYPTRNLRIRETGNYLFSEVQRDWRTWQAARASSQPAGEQVEALHIPPAIHDALSYAFDLLDRFNKVGGQGLREHDWIRLALQKLADANTALRALAASAQAGELVQLRTEVLRLTLALRGYGKHPEECGSAEEGACVSHAAYTELTEQISGAGWVWDETSDKWIAPVGASPIPAKVREALEQITRWDGFPDTGRFWDVPDNTEPMSYGACFGSNGEREFMREIAEKALASLPAPTGGQKP